MKHYLIIFIKLIKKKKSESERDCWDISRVVVATDSWTWTTPWRTQSFRSLHSKFQELKNHELGKKELLLSYFF